MSDIYFFHKADEIYESQVKPRFNYGLCTSCCNLVLRKSRARHEWAGCLAWLGQGVRSTINPSKEDPVEECSHYYPKGHMDIHEMYKVATLIDCSKKRTVGFHGNGDGEYDVTIKPPDEDNDGCLLPAVGRGGRH